MKPREQQRLQVLNQVLTGQWTVEEAAMVLDLSVRQVWRLRAAYERDGAAALVHGNRGRPSPDKLSEELCAQIVRLAEERYPMCNITHMAEMLALHDRIFVKRDRLRRLLQAAGVRPGRQRRLPKHRRRRDRAPQSGMLLQLDGSPHAWLGDDAPRCSVLGAIDDATGEVVAALFRAQEDSHGYFLLLRAILHAKGVPGAIYRDRHSIFQRDSQERWTREEELAGRQEPTQVGRALEELGITSIAARSPQAKGRIERLWGTFQDRLVAELCLGGITTLEAANAFLPAFLARYNAQFTVGAAVPGPAYRSVEAGLDLDRVLSFRYARWVALDNTVRLDGQVLQIPPGPGGRGYARAHVWVHELLDGSLGVWYNDQWLLRTPPPSQTPDLRARKRHRPSAKPGVVAVPRLIPDSPRPSTGPRKPADDHPWRRTNWTAKAARH